MDAKTCLQKLQYVGVLAFATVDKNGGPQIRNISAIHYEPETMYFFTAKGKDFCRQLLSDGRVQILGYTKYKEMIRLSAKARPVSEVEQGKWIDAIFAEQPYLSNVYPGDTRKLAGIVFEVVDAEIEYFNLGVNPIFRESYTVGKGTARGKGIKSQTSVSAAAPAPSIVPSGASRQGRPIKFNRNTACTAATAIRFVPSRQ